MVLFNLVTTSVALDINAIFVVINIVFHGQAKFPDLNSALKAVVSEECSSYNLSEDRRIFPQVSLNIFHN